jgi:gliding motility-associated-like protein
MCVLLCFACDVKGQRYVTEAFAPADFTVDTGSSPVYCFIYTPINNVSYRWGFYHKKNIRKEHLPFSESMDFEYKDGKVCIDYRDSLGIRWVCLETINTNGIRDTVCRKIWPRFEAVNIPPNVFSPDSRDSNSKKIFLISHTNGKEFNLFNLTVYNRWGAKVFETNDHTEGWNGKINNNGEECPGGTYFYILHYGYGGNDKEEPALNGTIQIIR